MFQTLVTSFSPYSYSFGVWVDSNNIKSISINQKPIVTTDNINKSYFVLKSNKGLNYKLSLAKEGENVTYEINQTPIQEAAEDLVVEGNDGFYYRLVLFTENGATFLDVGEKVEKPVAAPDTIEITIKFGNKTYSGVLDSYIFS